MNKGPVLKYKKIMSYYANSVNLPIKFSEFGL